MTTPEHQTVNYNDPASFNCSARGSSIEIIWQYNEDNYTMANSNLNIKVLESISEVNGGVSVRIVYSTLMIRSVTVGDSVSCFIGQRFDGSIDPDFNNEYFANALLDNETVFLDALTVISSPSTAPPSATKGSLQANATRNSTPTASAGKPRTLLPFV